LDQFKSFEYIKKNLHRFLSGQPIFLLPQPAHILHTYHPAPLFLFRLAATSVPLSLAERTSTPPSPPPRGCSPRPRPCSLSARLIAAARAPLLPLPLPCFYLAPKQVTVSFSTPWSRVSISRRRSTALIGIWIQAPSPLLDFPHSTVSRCCCDGEGWRECCGYPGVPM
jgi:hypothetical protein